MKPWRVLVINSILMMVCLAGCASAANVTITNSTPTETQAPTSAPQASLTPGATPTEITPQPGQWTPRVPRVEVTPAPGLAAQIEQAKADLASRLNIEPTAIQVLAAESVDWPDGSLGCPKPGVMYIQMVTPGALIRLQVAGKIYEYHSGRDNKPFYCKNALNPISTP